MAIKTLKEKGYGIVEFNNFTALNLNTRAQLPLSLDDFKNKDFPAEQGMYLVYDEAKGHVRKARTLDENVMFHKSEEKLYEEKNTLKDFCLFGQVGTLVNVQGPVLGEDGTITGTSASVTAIDFYSDLTPYPRLYKPIVNDTYTTNTVVYNDADFADFDAIKAEIEGASTEVWAAVCVDGGGTGQYDGYAKLSKTKPAAKVILRAIKAYTLPDGQPGIRFEIYTA